MPPCSATIGGEVLRVVSMAPDRRVPGCIIGLLRSVRWLIKVTTMRNCGYLGRLFAFVLAAFSMLGNAGATSANTDLSDIWWNPAESGWGMQMVNTGTFVFATVYVYGPNGAPTWVTAQLSRSGTSLPITYSGPLYVTTGPYFGGSFNPNAVTGRQAGSMTFVLASVSSGQLTYSVDGVIVNKSVQRQPLRLDNYEGEYVAVLTQTFTGCVDPKENGTLTDARAVSIAQNENSMAVVVTADNGFACTINGTFTQLGRMGQLQGAYSCNSGEVGTATFFEMSSVPFMFTARLQSQSTNVGCKASGEISAIIPR
jgi:hypothetical protein